jgi:response regulator RpfG family c-di-GMP phosphodiesterase
MISSTFINYVSNDIISEEIYQVVTTLINRYLRKEYFSTNGICISPKFTVHNAFIILLLNIASSIPKYLRTLKAHLYNEITQKFPQNSQMLVASIEEMVDTNTHKYTQFVSERVKALAENLKLTTRSLFE